MAVAPKPGEGPPKEEERKPPDWSWILGPIQSLANAILAGLSAFRDWIADGIKKFWDKVIPVKEVLPKEIYTSLTTTTPDWAKPLVNELTHYYLAQARAVITSAVESNPYVDVRIQKDVETRISNILMPAITTLVVSSVAAQLAELIHPLRELRVSETVKNVLTAFGLYAVVDTTWRLLYGEALIQPLKYELNALIRPWLPPQPIVDQMYFQEGITEEEWEDYYRKMGWSERWIAAWRKARYRPPSVWLLYRVIENPNVPEGWYDKVLRYHALDAEDRAVMIEAFKWIAHKDEIYRYRDRVVYYYKKGLINRERLIAELEKLPLTADTIELTVELADFESEMEVLEDKVNAIREGFRKGKITELEYMNQLKSLGIEERRIAAWLELDKLKRKVELRKTVVSLGEVG
jgi:hypothetical protein